MRRETRLALDLLRGSPEYAEDARAGAPVGNSVVGSLLSLPPHSLPRQVAEVAVREALALLDREQARREAAPPAGEGEDDGVIVLPRTGQSPLRFRGEPLAASDGERLLGREQNRWFELAVYRTAGGKYVVRVCYRTRWQGEADWDHASVVDRPEDVEAELRECEPVARLAGVVGFPVGDAYRERQERLLADLQRRYDLQVSEVLQSPEFAEEVE